MAESISQQKNCRAVATVQKGAKWFLRSDHIGNRRSLLLLTVLAISTAAEKLKNGAIQLFSEGKWKFMPFSASDDDSRHNLIKSKGPLNIQVLWEAPIVPPFFHVREASLCAKCACCLLKAMTFGGSSFEVSSFVLERNAMAVGRALDDLFLVSFIAKKLDRIWKRFISKTNTKAQVLLSWYYYSHIISKANEACDWRSISLIREKLFCREVVNSISKNREANRPPFIFLANNIHRF